MAKIEKKLNLILSFIEDLKLRISSIEDKLNSFDDRITKNENQLSIIEKTQQNLEKSVQNLQAEIHQIARNQAKLQHDTQLDLLNKDLYSKRFNFLIPGIPENSDDVWESRNVTEKLFKNFLIEGLNININDEIKIIDVHRLPQYPIFFENKVKINRPIIVKLNDAFSKQRFFSSLRNLKQYNNEKKENLHLYRIYSIYH